MSSFIVLAGQEDDSVLWVDSFPDFRKGGELQSFLGIATSRMQVIILCS